MKIQYFIDMDEFNRTWIIENALDEIPNYDPGVLTLRGLHYRLVARGMTNTIDHYKRVVSAMINARWDGTVDFETFSDHDRAMLGETPYLETPLEKQIQDAKDAITGWMTIYTKNRWENQNYYPEIFIEKKALQGVFQPICKRWNVTLGACKGYPSLTFLNDAASRYHFASDEGKTPIILYFGDYDPSGEDIPRSINDNLNRMGVDIIVKRIALMKNQVIEMGLPPAPIKPGDSRSNKWEGLGQVELDAINPNDLQEMCEQSIRNIIDFDAWYDLDAQTESEKETYINHMKNYIQSL